MDWSRKTATFIVRCIIMTAFWLTGVGAGSHMVEHNRPELFKDLGTAAVMLFLLWLLNLPYRHLDTSKGQE